MLGERVRSLKGIKGLFKNLLPFNLGKAITTGLTDKGTFSKLLGLGLRGLNFGRFLLGLGGPVGLALTIGSFIPDLYNLVKGSELGSRLISGIKEIGSKFIEGVKSFLGFKEKEVTKREVIKEVAKESTLSVVTETAKERILERDEGKVTNINVNITISNLTALNLEEIAEKVKAILIPEVKKAIEQEVYLSRSVY
ncbi:MAG: hypothetical protein DSY42_04670 [Aquifex sp.]|nr:MAG: hypothetical protein DSY42_04670 [Aquifex sp.]